MTDDLPDRIAAVYARGAGPWYEALAVLDTPLMPRWRLRGHRPEGLTGCRLCMRRTTPTVTSTSPISYTSYRRPARDCRSTRIAGSITRRTGRGTGGVLAP